MNTKESGIFKIECMFTDDNSTYPFKKVNFAARADTSKLRSPIVVST